MKSILKVGGIVVLLIVAALVLLSLSLNSIIKTGVETLGPQITGTPVTLEQANLSLLSGQGELQGLLVPNPQGFQTEYAFELGRVYVNAEIESVVSDKIMIKEIIIEAPEITFEGTLSGSNITKIQENVEKFSASVGGKDDDDDEEYEEEHESAEKKVQIDHFILKNAQVNISSPLLQGQEVAIPLPEIHLRDIGKKSDGATLQEVSSLVFSAIEKAIVQAVSKSGKLVEHGLKKIEEHLGGAAKEGASKVLEGVKGIFGD